MAVRRTDLYLPANNEHMIEKAPTRGADVITLDLEDAVPLSEKAAAREIAKRWIPKMSVNGAESWVRINAWDTDLTMDDLDAVVMEGLDGITLPKCSGPDDVKRLDFMLTDLEKKRALPVGGIKMAILIETAIGIMNVDQAVWCSDRLVAVIFGAVDYTRDMRVTRTDEADEQFFARGKIGVAARAAGLVAEDAPFPNYADDAAFEANTRSGAQLGFEGRQIIHPRQIPIAHKVYSPTPERIEWAKKITKAFEEEGLAKGSASVGVDGQMIDTPVYRDGLNILARVKEIEEKEAAKRK
ncbi:CoA ester lyase [Lachnospiraceae bacterium OF09-33XD]|nr:CoA ester lyase [Lachnospiraceae bacterium OF09-33XD]